jgi:hypothetical protein
VSAVATNVPIYNLYWGGWITVAGTSVAAPLIAGVYCLCVAKKGYDAPTGLGAPDGIGGF